MAASIINSGYEQAQVVLIGANNDISSSFGKGADKGPAAIRACLDSQVELREMRTGVTAVDRLKISWRDLGNLNGLGLPLDLAVAVDKVSLAVDEAIQAGRLPFMVGGDHSNTIGALRGLGRHYPTDTVTILHLDAHHDLRPDDTDYNDRPFGPLAHCCALRPAVQAGYNLVQVGIRAFSGEEEEFARQHRQQVDVCYWGRQVSFQPPTVSLILRAIATDLVYITIDADGFDPACMPATGTPVSGGLSWWYGWDLLQVVCRQKRIVGADLCEVAPRPHETLTEYNAAQLIYNIITWAWACGDRPIRP